MRQPPGKRANARLREFEVFISVKAQHYAYEQSDVDDFKQEGLIAAWMALGRDPDATKSYVQQAVDWRMIDYARKVYAHREMGYSPAHENLIYGNYGESEE
jgi:DNA-directed RNA polymerase specialized sigma24 family protein